MCRFLIKWSFKTGHYYASTCNEQRSYSYSSMATLLLTAHGLPSKHLIFLSHHAMQVCCGRRPGAGSAGLATCGRNWGAARTFRAHARPNSKRGRESEQPPLSHTSNWLPTWRRNEANAKPNNEVKRATRNPARKNSGNAPKHGGVNTTATIVRAEYLAAAS